MIVGPQAIPSIQRGMNTSGTVSAQLEMAKRLSGIDVVKPQSSQDYAAEKISRGASPDQVLASAKGGASSSGASDAKTGQGRAAEMLSRGIDPAIVIAADKMIAVEQQKADFGALRKAQMREMAMLTHNRAQEAYASADAVIGGAALNGGQDSMLDMRVG